MLGREPRQRRGAPPHLTIVASPESALAFWLLIVPLALCPAVLGLVLAIRVDWVARHWRRCRLARRAARQRPRILPMAIVYREHGRRTDGAA
jgi:hypothetical protein